MKQIILGTAGHIDHGKTSLIKALTGIDTDRLKEEKQRGITIELGFAHFELPGGQVIGIVDVPGHEKFVKNMVAGATGIDLVALVIAADEGVMPQTKEHLEICQLLDIRHGLVILTKIDMVDADWMELVREDVREYLSGTFLADAPVVEVSSVTGRGLPELTRTLETLAAEVPEKDIGHIFRIPVDRVFTMKGFGTVITGTSISGRIQTGDEITIYPQGLNAKIRGLQVHNREVDRVRAGLRTAVNLQGVEKAVIRRGDVLATKEALRVTYMVDVRLDLLDSAPRKLKNRARVRFHSGTSEIMARVVLLDREELMPGESCFAQVRLDEPTAVLKDDRFVIRSYSPVRTIGGGAVLNALPGRKKKRYSDAVMSQMNVLHTGGLSELIELFVSLGRFEGIEQGELPFLTNTGRKKLDEALRSLMARKRVA
ncbi:MAG: selenocysteine-specific translation elongation factor, partial [Deltaproteobacteria bacterium]